MAAPRGRSARSGAAVALAFGSLAAWVFRVRYAWTEESPRHPNCWTLLVGVAAASGAVHSSPTWSPPSPLPPPRAGQRARAETWAPFSSPPSALPPFYRSPIPSPSPVRPGSAPARPSPPLPASPGPFLPLRGPPLPSSFPPPPHPSGLRPVDSAASPPLPSSPSRPRLGPRPAPSSPQLLPPRLGPATPALAAQASRTRLLRWRAWPAPRQVQDVHLSVGPERISRSAAPGWDRPCCCFCPGSSSPRSGEEVSARGRGPGAGPGARGPELEEGARRLLGRFANTSRRPAVPGSGAQGHPPAQ